MPGWDGVSCDGRGDGGAVDGGVCFDVSIQSDATVSVVVSASVPVSGCHDSLLGSGSVFSVTKLLLVCVFGTS